MLANKADLRGGELLATPKGLSCLERGQLRGN